LSSPAIGEQQARKERDKRSLQRATIGVGVAALGLAGVLTYAAWSAAAPETTTPTGNTAPISSPDSTVVSNGYPNDDSSDSSDHSQAPRTPSSGVSSSDPRSVPVAVTGGS